MSASLWTMDAMADAMRASRAGPLPVAINGISIDSRTIAAGESYFAILGDVHDGHAFVDAALKNGAGVAIVADARRREFSADAPLLIVPDVLAGLADLGRAARTRVQGQVIAVTGSVGKTSTKEMLRHVFAAQGKTHASVASFNNHWGVPLTLARCPADARFAVFEIGMNHAGEITPLTQMVRPHAAIITTVEPVHLEFFANVEAIADAKAEIFSGIAPGGAAILNRDNPHFERLRAHAKAAGVSRIAAFGANPKSDARLLDVSLHATCSTVHARILSQEISYKLGVPGHHMVMNSLAVLAAATLAGADLAMAALSMSQMEAASGRGVRRSLRTPGGAATMIDESYNANPASMRAALTVLGQAEIHKRGRRIAVLGDMLELGPGGPALHGGLIDSVAAHHIDSVFCCGPLMRHLWEALPSARRGGYAVDAAALESPVLDAVGAGDVVMVKGSYGSKMRTIVAALERRFPDDSSPDDAQA